MPSVSAPPKRNQYRYVQVKTRLLLEEPFCRICASKGIRREATQVDHKWPRALGGEDVRANLQPLCVPCHRIKTKDDLHIIRMLRLETKREAAIRRSWLPYAERRKTFWRTGFCIMPDGTWWDCEKQCTVPRSAVRFDYAG